MPPVLVIHGGAGTRRSDERWSAMAAALRRIGDSASAALFDGASALEVVIEAARLLEDEPLFNAGLGSKLQVDGRARLSASLMDGETERFSGVINVEGLANPVLLCRALLSERDRVLAGAGALGRGRELGLVERDNRTADAIRRWEAAVAGDTGTVGAVALDASGRLAAATSTGGRGHERVGRVSDSATVAGNFACPAAAVSATGVGEHIVDGALAARLAATVEAGVTLAEAGAALRARMARTGWEAGFIAVDAHGNWIAPHSTPAMAWRAVTTDGTFSFDDPR